MCIPHLLALFLVDLRGIDEFGRELGGAVILRQFFIGFAVISLPPAIFLPVVPAVGVPH